MAIGKRARFEVFKRDSFRCQYCGRTPPEVILHVDHVLPKSGGGPDAMDNYVTACSDCNLGKSDVSLTSIPATIQQKIDLLRERQEQLSEYRKLLEVGAKVGRRQIIRVARHFKRMTGEKMPVRLRCGSMMTFLKHFTEYELQEFIGTAVNACPAGDLDRVVRYFCGMCWRRIKGELPGNC